MHLRLRPYLKLMRNKYIGTFNYKNDSNCFVVCEDRGVIRHIGVAAELAHGAFDGDTVEVTLLSNTSPDGSSNGRITKLIARKQDRVLGTISYDRFGTAFFNPRDYIPCQMPLDGISIHDFDEDELVLADIIPAKNGKSVRLIPQKSYGKNDSYEANLACALDGLPFGNSFSEDSAFQAREIMRLGHCIPANSRRIYEDRIFCPVISSDDTVSDTAYGIDCTSDATLVYIHVSDVDAIVKKESPLAAEAFSRFRSILDASSSKYSLFPKALVSSAFNLLSAETSPHPTITFKLEICDNLQPKLISVEESFVNNVIPLNISEIQRIISSFSSDAHRFSTEFKRIFTLARALRRKRITAGGLSGSNKNVGSFGKKSKAFELIDYDTAQFIFDELLFAAGEALANYYTIEGVAGLFASTANQPGFYTGGKVSLYYRPFYEACRLLHPPEFTNNAIAKARESGLGDLIDPYISFNDCGFLYSAEPKPNRRLGLSMYAPIAHPVDFFDAVIQQRAIRAMLHRQKFEFSEAEQCSALSETAAKADRNLRLLNALLLLRSKDTVLVKVISDGSPALVRTDDFILGELTYTRLSSERVRKGTWINARVRSISFTSKEVTFGL